MKQKKTSGIMIFGWFFIILSFLYAITVPKIIFSHHKLASLAFNSLENINFLPKITIYSIIGISVGFLLLFITGIGILKLKRWAYYIALSLPFMYFMMIIKNIWLLGSQTIIRPATFFVFFISIIIILFLMRKSVIEHFNADYVTKKGKKLNPKKFILWSLIIVILVNGIPIVSWMLWVNVKFKEQLPIINLKPQKIEYRIQDKSFILNNCEKRVIFDYSVYIPKDWKIATISIGDSGVGWHLNFLNMENSNLKSFIMLYSKGFGQLLLPISKVLNFNTTYDFERTINYPNWTPIYLMLKTTGSSRNLVLVGIDEATTSTWRGFVKVIKSKRKDMYDGSLYSLKGSKTCSITVLSKDRMMTSQQAKSIIASLEFKANVGDSELLFKKGKDDLANANFVSATINFMNALYNNERNPKYAYYLAQSLFKDTSVAGRKARLASSKKILEYTLKLNPSHPKAKELLVSVDNEINQEEQDKKYN